MNRTDRLLAIVLELQAHGVRRAEDLAATFETSKRTIYRDIQALCEAGVPVVAEPGRGYSLVEGYFLPPLRFSAEEAIMLLLGADVMAQSFDADYGAAAEAASRKIAGVLPDDMRAQVQSLRESIRFVAKGPAAGHAAEVLRSVRRAIVAQQTLRFRYTARSGQEGTGAQSLREANPYALVHINGVWYLTAYCHTRKDIRNFRIERMEQLVVLDRTFTRPPGYRPQLRGESDRRVVVRVLFEREIARWVREARSFYTVAEEERADGLLVTLGVRQEDDVLQWLLGWGARAHVLEPQSLRRRLAEEAQALVLQYSEDAGTKNREPGVLL